MFVGGLKAVAPVLVFVIVAGSIANQKKNAPTNMRSIIFLYLAGTFMAALIALTMGFLFLTHLLQVLLGAMAESRSV